MGLIEFVKNKATYEGVEPMIPGCVGGMFDYVLTAGGVYVHARRDGLEVSFPIAICHLRGVEPSAPLFAFDLPRVPVHLVENALMEASGFASHNLETLFHLEDSQLNPFAEGWTLATPRQERTATTCRPLDDGEGSSHDRAIIEIHSHHSMAARFSRTDDADETGFRLYGVMGRLDQAPEIRMRVGCYGYFWEIPASWVLELPGGLRDCNAMEGE